MKTSLNPEEKQELLAALRQRFEKNPARHAQIKWEHVLAKLEPALTGDKTAAIKLESLYKMEETGGEPDVVDYNSKQNEFLFVDCSAESPVGRRSVCYDYEAQVSRKEHQPQTNALDMAAEMGINLLTEEQYRALQKLGPFDTKTSSWILTPEDIRKRGGALFCDFRYGHVFVYHNGAQSYYAARGFRGALWV